MPPLAPQMQVKVQPGIQSAGVLFVPLGQNSNLLFAVISYVMSLRNKIADKTVPILIAAPFP